jgi:tetratricopeptide (TPR) repeat protein
MFNIKNLPKYLSISLTFVLVSIALVSFSQSKLSQLVIQSKPAIFSITCYDKSDIPFSYGTGFFIDSEGTGLTNYHVLEGASYAIVKTLDGNHYRIDQIISQNKKIDLIKFKVKKTSKLFPYLKLCPTNPIEAEEVLVIGNPKELEYSVSNGIISSIRLDEEIGKVIQTTAPISSGSSGSPLLNLKGEVLGVISFTMKEGQNLNFAISVNNIVNLISSEYSNFPASEGTKEVSSDHSVDTEFYIRIIASYTESIRINPKDVVAFRRRGDAKSTLKDYIGAIEDYNKAIELDSGDEFDFFSRGKAKYYLEDYTGAIEDFAIATELNPLFEESFKFSGSAKIALGAIRGAIADYTEAINIHQYYAEAYLARGDAKYMLQENLSAISDYNKVIELKKPKTVGSMWQGNGPIPDVGKAIVSDEMLRCAYFNRGSLKIKLEDYRGAIIDFSKAIELNPQYARAYLLRAEAKTFLKDYLGAVADYTQAIELNSEDSFSFEGRGIAKFHLEDYRGSILDFNQAILLNPKYAPAYFKRGASYSNLGQKDKACLDFSKAGELGFKNAYDFIKKYCNN